MRMYTAVFKAIGVTVAQDFFELGSPADAVVKVWSWTVSQTTEVGDGAEEMLQLTTNRGVGAVSSGSGGASVTPQPVSDGDPAFGGTVERNNTTILAVGSGTLETDLEIYAWNIRVPYQRIYLPEERPTLSPSTFWTLECETAPADSITISGTLVFEEIGG